MKSRQEHEKQVEHWVYGQWQNFVRDHNGLLLNFGTSMQHKLDAMALGNVQTNQGVSQKLTEIGQTLTQISFRMEVLDKKVQEISIDTETKASIKFLQDQIKKLQEDAKIDLTKFRTPTMVNAIQEECKRQILAPQNFLNGVVAKQKIHDAEVQREIATVQNELKSLSQKTTEEIAKKFHTHEVVRKTWNS